MKSSSPPRSAGRRPARPFRPCLETLEERVNLTGLIPVIPPREIVVTSPLDSGAGTLRDAIAQANAVSFSIISFAPQLRGQAITLNSSIVVSGSVNLDGLGSGATTIRGTSADRLFDVLPQGDLSIQDMTLTGGHATTGGAIRTAGSLDLTRCVVTGNVADLDGGAIASVASAAEVPLRVTLIETWLRDNVAGRNGGAISLEVGSCSISGALTGNAANEDGGALFVGEGGGSVRIANATISGNSAGDDGGGVYFSGREFGASVEFEFATVTLNRAGTISGSGLGGGVRIDPTVLPVEPSPLPSSVTFKNTIVVRNGGNPGNVGGADLSGNVRSFVTSILGANEGVQFTDPFDASQVGDPGLAPLRISGGMTPTHALPPGSIAINRGRSVENVTSDQRGFAFERNYAGSTPDIGAYEFGSGLGGDSVFAVGTDAGVQNTVRVFNGTSPSTDFHPYVPGFVGGVRVATGDFNGDGFADIVTAAGPGGGPNVKIFDGVTRQEIASFFAFESTFDGGVSLGVADVNADGVPDIVCGAGPGGGPRIIVVDGKRVDAQDATGVIDQNVLLASFFAYVPNFNGGVTISSGDFNGDGQADLAFAAGPGGGPHVRIVDGTRLNSVDAQGVITLDAGLVGDTTDFSSFFAFGAPTFTGGVVLTTGDINGDGLSDLIVGIASRGASSVFVRDGATKAFGAAFNAFEPQFTGGVRLATADLDFNGSAESLVIGRGRGGLSQVRIVNGTDPGRLVYDVVQFGAFAGGIFVG